MDDVRITARVAQGARWLDEHRPGWLDEIDPTTLDLGNQKRCILAQLYGGGYWRAPAEFAEWNSSEADQRAAEHGFFAYAELGDNPSGVDAEYAALTVAWGELITERREAEAARGVTSDGA